MEGFAYTELIDSRNALKTKYDSEFNKLMAKKEKLFQTLDITKWEINDDFNKIDRVLLMKDKQYALSKMCTRETQSLENLHNQLGYANKCNMDELKNIINKHAQKFVENTKKFADEFYPTLNDGISVWSSLASYI